jgi:mannose-6-phosphate isomerase-like protein (cupin superfamily)
MVARAPYDPAMPEPARPPIFREADRAPLATLDGSSVRELIQTGDGAANQSLAEATVPPGGETIEHLHRDSEELYRFVSGRGRMKLGDALAEVRPGDTALIAPGTPHKLWNTGDEPLVLLCCCAPPYRDDDTELLE